ncbi:menaquinone-dependent protoporphyrinogen IX dehydrogenase [Psychromonas sp. psych-6C06]|uniref:menaquinone-dependent protoporphyrinogen IX dehydrogenase n=1 Tax=Psychromonas sp. psych-6C06 TaxID=2058089 RepID=UPI000C3485EF|nr:menaquinone-dependent protoporphyrinogen IX dehydrogenase [Psychromonas sp. psych-6C06]PKF61509.1 menaquinone-dependent protoporphyrinogen IX dehydrogenase [Psychromonas sp. psych-6C06]
MTTKTLVLYSSVDGQTLKIIERINTLVEGEFKLFDIDKNPDIAFDEYAKVLIGASIRYGNFRSNLIEYVNTHKTQIDKLPNAFFLVCLTARKPEKSLPSNNTYMAKFNALSDWQPRLKGVFAGALLYSRYNWWQTLLIQLIMKMTGGSTDKSKDIELTDWSKVESFSKDFSDL